MATLLLELTLTRIYSVIFYYHFAFLAISVALFGLGAGGVFSYVVSGWSGTLYQKLGRLAAFNSISVIASLVFLLTRKGTPGNLELVVIYFFSALPFLLAGAIVSLVISETIDRIERVYFFDLLGAAGRTLLKRTVSKDDVAEQLITFCRSDSVTGQTILMDSGRV